MIFSPKLSLQVKFSWLDQDQKNHDVRKIIVFMIVTSKSSAMSLGNVFVPTLSVRSAFCVAQKYNTYYFQFLSSTCTVTLQYFRLHNRTPLPHHHPRGIILICLFWCISWGFICIILIWKADCLLIGLSASSACLIIHLDDRRLMDTTAAAMRFTWRGGSPRPRVRSTNRWHMENVFQSFEPSTLNMREW